VHRPSSLAQIISAGLRIEDRLDATQEARDAPDLADPRVETLTPLERPDLVAGIEGQQRRAV